MKTEKDIFKTANNGVFENLMGGGRGGEITLNSLCGMPIHDNRWFG